MIHLEDIMLNNWYEFIDYDERIIKVDADILSDIFANKISLDNINPIPLTPEIMSINHFEFIKRSISGADMFQGVPFWVLKISGFDITLAGNLSRTRPGYLRPVEDFNTQIFYVHDLQNWFRVNKKYLSIDIKL